MTEPVFAKAAITLNGEPVTMMHRASHAAACAMGTMPARTRPVQPAGDGLWMVEVTQAEKDALAEAGGDGFYADGPFTVRFVPEAAPQEEPELAPAG